MKKSVCGDDILENGRHPVVLQARAKCFVLQRIRVYYISLEFNSVVCNYGLFQLIRKVINRFGQWCVDFMKFYADVNSWSGPPCRWGFGIWEKIRCGLRFGVFLCGFAVFGPPLRPQARIQGRGNWWIFTPPPFFWAPFFFFFPYPSNIEIIFDFSAIITKFHPPPPHFKILSPPLAPPLHRERSILFARLMTSLGQILSTIKH